VNYLAVQDARRYESAFGVQMPLGPWAWELYPKSRGAFIRRRSDVIELEREATGGTWGLLPWFAKTPEIKFNTVNARFETVATTASYKAPWTRGQRCIVPMDAFFEPNWETGKHCADRRGRPVGAVEREGRSGDHQLHAADRERRPPRHPLMSRMHRLGQEKRMLALLDPAEYDEWLERPPAGAFELLQEYPPELLLDEPWPKPPAERSLALEEMADVLMPDN